MSHDEETLPRSISKSIKDIGQFTRSNQINGNLRQIAKEQTLCRSHSPLQHVGNIGLKLIYCKSFFTKPPISEGLYNAQYSNDNLYKAHDCHCYIVLYINLLIWCV